MKKRKTDTLPIIDVEENFDNETEVLKYQLTEDEELLQRIVMQNLPLVLNMAEKYWFPTKMSRNELVSEGTIGLIEAIKTYEAGENKFSTYATHEIIYKMLDCASRWYGEGSRYLGALIMQYRKLAISIFGETHFMYDEDTVDYVLDLMLQEGTLNSKSVKEIRSRLLSKEIELVREEIKSIEDTEYQEEMESQEESEETLFIRLHKDELFEGLTEKRKMIMEYRYGFRGGHPHYQEEIAKILGISRQAVQEYEKKAMTKIKKNLMKIEGSNNGN